MFSFVYDINSGKFGFQSAFNGPGYYKMSRTPNQIGANYYVRTMQMNCAIYSPDPKRTTSLCKMMGFDYLNGATSQTINISQVEWEDYVVLVHNPTFSFNVEIANPNKEITKLFLQVSQMALVDAVYIHSNTNSNSYTTNGMQTDILDTFPILNQPSEIPQPFYVNNTIYAVTTTGSSLGNINLRLTDEFGV